ncbi:hypothetical protein RIF23_00220 [Lipingzhangella sp. LS1_29]|uniref:Uncharacterized protein n=1 Tax=Lipingzhangella rawalii TaxID=2055835 RepID=A0ABU2H071_9ACTN|nr:hypothetical protein [Lipingzhangella rawalii]MDS1268713.1 hypothetical protein [Lipingzhangella rawalii]
MTAILTRASRGQDLVDPALLEHLVNDVRREHGHNHATAERIVDQALVYLVACGRTSEPIGPSELVDRGWHAFILRTAEYRDFCARVLGSFVDHHPNDVRPTTVQRASMNARTLDAVYATGLYVDLEMWAEIATSGSNCSDAGSGGSGDGCHKGCHDSQAR